MQTTVDENMITGLPELLQCSTMKCKLALVRVETSWLATGRGLE